MADDGVETLDLGSLSDPEPADRGPGRRRPALTRRHVLLGLGGLGGIGALAAVAAARRSPPPLGPRPLQAGELRVRELGRPLLAGAPVHVFGFTHRELVHVDVTGGRITRTGLGGLEYAALDVVPVRGGAVVHRSDDGPGYFVPDGEPPTDLPPQFETPGPILPGPDADHVWVMARPRPSAPMWLMALDGTRVGSSVGVAAELASYPVPDGGGYPLFLASDGTYSAGPRGLRRVTTGAFVAGGPRGWLVLECDENATCASVLVSRWGGRRPLTLRPLEGSSDAGTVVGGSLGPDGRRAALYIGEPARALRLDLVDLASGRRTPTGTGIAPGAVLRPPQWSPDGTRAFSLDDSGRIVTVDAGSGATAPLVPDGLLPPLEDIAIRA